ncbi:MAG: metal-dependent transcriptional regulator [Thermoprotei archaeon]
MFGLSDKEAKYIKAIEKLGGSDVRLRDLAKDMCVSTPSALEEVRHLMAKGIVVNNHGFIGLTPKGRRALESLRRAHIALETIFARQGLTVEEACSEIHSFDYAVPEALAEKLYEAAGKPTFCPKGKAEC